MTPKEQEIAINELEERVDRLRNIYEQYFLGFEKLEPTVPKKDVERRFAILRKEQIRNTAMRFRFQVVTQKYNTYSMHWVRICRQIEEGTYKRHIRKAKARFGDGAASDARSLASDVSIDIEIDLDDFESDLAAFTDAEAAPDTLPPPALVPPSVRAPSAERTPRGAALPAGATRKVLRKREDAEGGPSSVRPQPAAAPASVRPQPAAAARMAPPDREFPPTQPGVPGISAPRSAPRVPAAAPPGMEQPVRPRIALRAGAAPGAISGGRLPVAPAASGARIPVGPAAPSGARIPVAPAAAAPGTRIPVAPAATAPSAGRMPVAGPPGAAAANRLPPPPPLPSGRGSSPDLAQPPTRPRPAPPASAGLPVPQPRPGARPPMPSAGDRDDHDTLPPPPDSHSGARQRLPLPSQLGRPKKE